jgi:hypothetical protein
VELVALGSEEKKPQDQPFEEREFTFVVDLAAFPAEDSIASMKPTPSDADARVSWRAATEPSVGGHAKAAWAA